MGFLLSRKWIGFFVVVVALAYLAVRLGDWQFHRLDERRADNAVTERNVAELPSPVDQVMRVGQPLPSSREWRRVTVTGEYDDARTLVVRYRTRDSQPGVEVVTPLRTQGGAAVVVDRGWLATENSGARPTELPPAEKGLVTVTGYVRVDATGGSTAVEDDSTRAISSTVIGKRLPYPAYGGFVLADSQVPRPDKALGGPELPELDDGPHFFYGIQWWFFGALAIAGFGYLVVDEVRRRRDEREAGARDEDDELLDPEPQR
ncbi:SURF1 family cytochrome oxidase biogenesis protein [Marmoricola endophyticus]|uniref:SURF1 family cytochrome oxidase biogenesis protein n=1 Tax=Marmoricola endophyticus TaxID=2040280 RepID=UPI001666F7E6|nr:SURF1 family protein [Marmoricola endophyticus]